MSATDPNLPPTPPASAAEAPDTHPHEGAPFPIVGVGASAGGLEAFTELLENLPADAGLAVLFALHLDPHHKSHLQEILAKVTAMPVHEVTQGMHVEPNQVYLLPPNTNMALTDGRLTLSPRSLVPGRHMPVDHLFRSLAAIQKGRAIGVVLSGGGTDGALGLQSIKAEGGITLAQDEKTAQHPSMPRAATLDGHVDYVLSPGELARQLVRVVRHPYTEAPDRQGEPLAGSGDVIAEILRQLRASTDVDFVHYKRTTIRRRILRRMALRGIDRIQDYAQLLRDDPTERHSLYQDFLIRVTQFFRDPEAFELLKARVFPALLKDRPGNRPVRVWVAGCATGEEVYALAICLLEYAETRPEPLPVKILATDLSETALDKARAGVYLDNIEIDVSPGRLRRFFVRTDGHYQISKAVREMCVFSRHNLAVDPPFSHLDLISCRNVLIYMDTTLQNCVLPVLHYALNPDGFLFLGTSESVGHFTDFFTPVDPKHRIFVKNSLAPGMHVEFPTRTSPEARVSHPAAEPGAPLWNALDVQREADRVVLARHAPVGVVVDEAGTVLQFRGRTAPFLEPAPGMASLDLFRMLREGMLADVRAAFNQARAENAAVRRDLVQMLEGGRVRPASVEIIPFKVPPSGARFFLVLFTEAPSSGDGPPAAEAAPAAEPTPMAQQVPQLQQELAALREYLQSVIEEQESTNEELKSANEEILSANEELQSTNEELQTAKEEAQSANEELATVNEELRHRNAELARANDDLVNVFSGVNIPIVLVGRDLRIRRFTPLAEKVFNLIPTDLGRPISDIQSNLNVADLTKLILGVMDTLTPHETEVRDADGHTYSLRVRPYVTLDNKIDGASVVLVDIDAIKRRLDSRAPPRPATGEKDGP